MLSKLSVFNRGAGLREPNNHVRKGEHNKDVFAPWKTLVDAFIRHYPVFAMRAQSANRPPRSSRVERRTPPWPDLTFRGKCDRSVRYDLACLGQK